MNALKNKQEKQNQKQNWVFHISRMGFIGFNTFVLAVEEL
jgi:hypothetical protein